MRNTDLTRRAHPALVYLLLLTLALFGASCKRSGTDGNANTNSAAGSTSVAEETSTTPPFSTKEPERYQATMVITSSLGEQSNIPGMAGLTTKQMMVARDGDKRRVDLELFPGAKVAYLQTAAGRYMLVPDKKVYAEFNPGGASDPSKNLSSGFSPDELLNQSSGGARYEKLGAENVNGRSTVKYRVTVTGKTGEAKSATTESLIWIDESLGMPVKSETTLGGGGNANSKYSMELRDLKQEVDQSVFELPTDYRKIDYKDIQREIVPSVPGLTDKD
ncbi:MAG TPA: hypothetical protein VEQ40_07765 [Pyrinomonadaceae bacterium]|nr:hypothetical protein [Pyrinomonadaceae bacterium]